MLRSNSHDLNDHPPCCPRPSGWRRRGLLRGAVSGQSDESDDRFEQLREKRAFLLAAVGGCENTLHLLMRISDRAVSCRDVAAPTPYVASTVWRWVQQCFAGIRWTGALADLAVMMLRSNSGFTIDPRSMMQVDSGGSDAWAVSVAGATQRCPSPPTLSDIAWYLARHGKRLRSRRRPRLYFGGWKDPDTTGVVLDLTLLVPGLKPALALARKHRQRCIYNLGTGQERYLDQDLGRKAA